MMYISFHDCNTKANKALTLATLLSHCRAFEAWRDNVLDLSDLNFPSKQQVLNSAIPQKGMI